MNHRHEQELELSDLRSLILRAFFEKARLLGIRAVIIGELCHELGISKKTLYRYFPSKASMVEELMNRWEVRLQEPDAIAQPANNDPVAALIQWVEHWSVTDATYSDAFWNDLQRDYPASYARYVRAQKRRSSEVRRLIRPMLREAVSERFATLCYAALVEQARTTKFAEASGMQRRETMLLALDVFLRGVLKPEFVQDIYQPLKTGE